MMRTLRLAVALQGGKTVGMTDAPLPDPEFLLKDDAATAALGAFLAPRLAAGDCLLLEGPIGAGKSHLARALIRERLGRFEDIPSPTFTLVQTYDAGDVEIWHADLYRLTHPDEVLELGLEDAFSRAICLVEWPDRLGAHLPQGALRLRLAVDGDGRRVAISGGRADLRAAIAGFAP